MSEGQLIYSAIGSSSQRVDIREKVDGSLKYFTDMKMDGMLYGVVFRSTVTHARIRSMDVTKAISMPGIRAVLTSRDIKGMNAYGVIVPDAPVLAYDKVRFYGEPLALIAGDTLEQAEAAKDGIKVDYEPLPVIRNIDEALKNDAPLIHNNGNIARSMKVERGDLARGFKDSYLVLDRDYRTHMQKHMFLETEAGLGYLDEKGVINIFVSGQGAHSYKGQITRALEIPPDKLRIVNYPEGGAFGGKDDVTIQILLTLLVMKTKKPVKLVLTREESGAGGYHRHASLIHLKTGVSKDGRFMANKAHILLDTGAYVSFGPSVLDTAMEVINGKYRIPNISVEGTLVYTNNGFSSAFRGFGAPQGNFAIENMVDELAYELKMDPIDFRLLNLLQEGEINSFGNPERDTMGAHVALTEAKGSRLWKISKKGSLPWIKVGLGVSFGVKGVGYGPVKDVSYAAVEVIPSGLVKAFFSNADYGQGINTGHLQIVAQKLGIPFENLRTVNADTAECPDTGSSDASRSTFTGGNALINACDQLIEVMKPEAARMMKVQPTEISYADGKFTFKEGSEVSIFDIASFMAKEGKGTKFIGSFEMPRVAKPIEGMIEAPRFSNAYGVLLSLVEVNELTGLVKAKAFDFYADIGKVINPLLALSQCESGLIQGLGYAITEELTYDVDGKPLNTNYTTYIVPSTTDIPSIDVRFVDAVEKYGPYGAKGVGEIPIVPVASSLTNAVHDAIGMRFRELPLSPPRVSSRMQQNKGISVLA
ncbi:MAG: xanthine dehydrogenase family protein molybdopterin-binding subunit [Nitrososphaerota archaeon]|nr:xanthine dehydrogenase family protein molybdopterin-binding subunit [Nitrososphaerota archaeon]